jgi:hypothetical protein
MNRLLIIIHFLAFGAGFAVAAGNNLAMMLAARAPAPEAAGLRRFPAVMTHIGDAGLVLLWLTGIILLWTRYGGIDGFAALPWAFWAKLACVVLITALVGLMHMTAARIKRGDMSVAARMPVYGRIGLGLLILIVIFAVMAFD